MTSPEIEKTIKSIQDGTIGTTIKTNMQKVFLGVAYGAIVGFVVSTITGGGKIRMVVLGALAGGSLGYMFPEKTATAISKDKTTTK